MNDKLRTVLDHEIERSVSWAASTIREEQERNLAYYLGLPMGNEVEGRSQVVSWDVFEIVESALPSFLEPLFGGDNIAEFQPQGPEDEEKARQATDYINYLVTERNEGFMVFYTWIKDALLSKVGVVRPEWQDQEPQRCEYEGLTQEQVTLLMQDSRNEIIEAEIGGKTESEGAEPGEPADQMEAMYLIQQPIPVYDVTVLKHRPGKVNLRNVKPSEFIISQDARTPDDAKVIGEIVVYTRSELKEMKLKRWADVSDYDAPFSAVQYTEPDGHQAFLLSDDAAAFELEQVRLFKGFVRCDCNGDGIAEWRDVLVGGGPDDILVDEEATGQDYAVITPIPIPHRVIGMAYADPASEIQRLKTGLTRQYLDSLYLANRPRTYVNMQAATGTPMIEDMLSDRIGGLIRGNGPAQNALQPIQTSLVANESLQGLQFADTMRETRLGITKYNQGLDANSLNKTATGIGKIMQASEMRLKTTLRIMAYTGFKRLYKTILRLTSQKQDVADVIKLRNEWVTFNPGDWDDSMDCKIQLGSTNAERMEEVQHLQLFGQFMQQGAPVGVTTPKNVYEFGKTLARASRLMGAEEKYLTDPSAGPQKPPTPSPEQIKAQADMQKTQAEMQADQQKFQAQAQIDASEAEKQRAHELQLEEMKGAHAERLKLFELASGLLARAGAPQGNIINGTQLDTAGQVINPQDIGMTADAINQLASQLQTPQGY